MWWRAGGGQACEGAPPQAAGSPVCRSAPRPALCPCTHLLQQLLALRRLLAARLRQHHGQQVGLLGAQRAPDHRRVGACGPARVNVVALPHGCGAWAAVGGRCRGVWSGSAALGCVIAHIHGRRAGLTAATAATLRSRPPAHREQHGVCEHLDQLLVHEAWQWGRAGGRRASAAAAQQGPAMAGECRGKGQTMQP